MSFETTERWAAFDPSILENLSDLEEAYGGIASDGQKKLKTILAFYDDSARTRICGSSYPENICPTPLTDGRIAVRGLWSQAIVAAWRAGEIEAEELTAEQVETLRVKDE